MKKKQTGKFMAMALTAAMLGGMLAGCGNNAANAPADTTPAPETPPSSRRRAPRRRFRFIRYRRVRLQRKHPLQAASR